MKNNKKGNAIVTYPFVLLICVMCMISVGIFFLNAIFPFIWYQKLNVTVQKYMFVVEKFGYLTDEERNHLKEDLDKQGFDLSKIQIEAPNVPLSFGELVNFTVSYQYEYKSVNFVNGKIESNNRELNMVVSKNSYSKI